MNQKAYFQELNFANDSRNCEPNDIPNEYPTKWEVCPICNGKGTHVNPSIDCGGLTYEDFQDDSDFLDDYMSGTYDQTCNKCNGRTTIKVVDWDRMSQEQKEEYETQLEEERQMRNEHLAELRMGA